MKYSSPSVLAILLHGIRYDFGSGFGVVVNNKQFSHRSSTALGSSSSSSSSWNTKNSPLFRQQSVCDSIDGNNDDDDIVVRRPSRARKCVQVGRTASMIMLGVLGGGGSGGRLPLPAHAAASSRAAVASKKKVAVVAKKKSQYSVEEEKFPVLTTTAVVALATGVSYKKGWILKWKKSRKRIQKKGMKVDDDSADMAARERQYRSIVGIRPPTPESSAAEVYIPPKKEVEKPKVEEPKDDVVSADESPLYKLVKDKDIKGENDDWFQKAMSTSMEVEEASIKAKEEANKREMEILAAEEEARIAEEEARLAEEALREEEDRYEREAKLAEEAVMKAEAEALRALEEAERGSEETQRLVDEQRLSDLAKFAEETRLEEERLEKLKAPVMTSTNNVGGIFFEEEEVEISTPGMTLIERRRALARSPSRTYEEEVELSSYYSEMTEEERAAAILTDLGIVQDVQDPDDPQYDPTFDDEYCDDYENCEFGDMLP